AVVGRTGRFHAAELLDGNEAGHNFVTAGQGTATARLHLPLVSQQAAPGRLLDLSELQDAIRHLRETRNLSNLLGPLSRDAMPRLRTGSLNQRVDGSRACRQAGLSSTALHRFAVRLL